MADKPIYLDNSSTTRTDQKKNKKMLPYFTEEFGNASSITHEFGRAAGAAVDQARQDVASLLGCEPKSLVFTSGATESNNLALLGAMRAATNGKHLIINAAEHKAIIDPAKRLEAEGFEVTVLPVDKYGRVKAADVKTAIREDTALVSVMHGNNEVGTINPIAEISELCRQAEVLFHTDATQTVGKLPINLSKLHVDLLSCSAHKMYGPKGIGALFVRRGLPRVRIEPLVEGGGHERKMRSGTLPVQQIVGLGEACRICKLDMQQEAQRITLLREQLRHGLANSIDGIQFNGHPSERLPGSLHVSVPGANAEAVMMQLRTSLAISSGSACTMSSPQPSHVLQAISLDSSYLSKSLRFGIGRFNTEAEILEAIKLTSASVQLSRDLSGYSSKNS